MGCLIGYGFWLEGSWGWGEYEVGKAIERLVQVDLGDGDGGVIVCMDGSLDQQRGNIEASQHDIGMPE